jgi:predicted Fe-S protein YdhL (DUF1289 family)
MTTKISPPDHIDHFDVTEFRALLDSDAYKAIMARIEQEHRRAVDLCVRATDQITMWQAQGAAKALEVIPAIGERMLDEMRAKLEAAQKAAEAFKKAPGAIHVE